MAVGIHHLALAIPPGSFVWYAAADAGDASNGRAKEMGCQARGFQGGRPGTAKTICVIALMPRLP